MLEIFTFDRLREVVWVQLFERGDLVVAVRDGLVDELGPGPFEVSRVIEVLSRCECELADASRPSKLHAKSCPIRVTFPVTHPQILVLVLANTGRRQISGVYFERYSEQQNPG